MVRYLRSGYANPHEGFFQFQLGQNKTTDWFMAFVVPTLVNRAYSFPASVHFDSHSLPIPTVLATNPMNQQDGYQLPISQSAKDEATRLSDRYFAALASQPKQDDAPVGRSSPDSFDSWRHHQPRETHTEEILLDILGSTANGITTTL
jgi:hypothetical protein